MIKGCGFDILLEQSNLSTIGTSSITDVNNNKRARYCLEVCSSVLFRFLIIDHKESGSTLQIVEYLDEKSKKSQMCFYLKLILELEKYILLFVRSIREGNFNLYLETLFQSLKYFFSFDKYNYARWATVYWFDLAALEIKCPDLFKRLSDGNFSFQKTSSPFLKNCS